MQTKELEVSVLGWIRARLAGRRTPFVLGVNAPQGAGKTTLTRGLCEALAAAGTRAVCLSVDDFYLTRPAQVRLAAQHPRNPYLQMRGYPGTHDIDLGARTLAALVEPAPGVVRVPRYDKGAWQGEGDRLPEADWTAVERPLDLVLLEGWMLGFSAVGAEALSDPRLAPVDAALPAYQAWHGRLDGFLQLVPVDYRFVLEWRVEAEAKVRAAGRPAMSDARIREYVETFLPAYATWLPRLAERPPVGENLLRVEIGRDRAPTGVGLPPLPVDPARAVLP